MPNVYRLDRPGSLHHVMSHCVEGCRAFDEECFRTDFLKRLTLLVGKGAIRIHAWALMPNHYHLLMETADAPLAVTMHRLLTGFASEYNRRNSRRGHVFDARFRSILVERESYFLRLMEYIHFNPLKAGIISTLRELEDYPWTGYSAIMGRQSCRWMTTDVLESLLDAPGTTLRDRYQNLHEVSTLEDDMLMDSGSYTIGAKGLQEHDPARPISPHSRAIRILGSKSFALDQYGLYRNHRRANLRNRHEQHVAMELLLSMIAEQEGVPGAILRSGGRGKKLSRARRLLIRELVRIAGVTQADVASFLRISQPAVSQILERPQAEN